MFDYNWKVLTKSSNIIVYENIVLIIVNSNTDKSNINNVFIFLILMTMSYPNVYSYRWVDMDAQILNPNF